jgi:hypothetical protein
VKRDKWDALFDSPDDEALYRELMGDTDENVIVRHEGGNAVSIEHGHGFIIHHDIVVTRPWASPPRERVKPARTRALCARCGAKFGRVRRERFCSKPCYQADYRQRMSGRS